MSRLAAVVRNIGMIRPQLRNLGIVVIKIKLTKTTVTMNCVLTVESVKATDINGCPKQNKKDCFL